MTSPEEYLSRLQEMGVDDITIAINTLDEARSTLTYLNALRKQLLQVKREVNADMKTIRAEYAQKLSTAGTGSEAFGQLMGTFGVKGAKGRGKSSRAYARQNVRDKQAKALKPYEDIKLFIDDLIVGELHFN